MEGKLEDLQEVFDHFKTVSCANFSFLTQVAKDIDRLEQPQTSLRFRNLLPALLPRSRKTGTARPLRRKRRRRRHSPRPLPPRRLPVPDRAPTLSHLPPPTRRLGAQQGRLLRRRKVPRPAPVGAPDPLRRPARHLHPRDRARAPGRDAPKVPHRADLRPRRLSDRARQLVQPPHRARLGVDRGRDPRDGRLSRRSQRSDESGSIVE